MWLEIGKGVYANGVEKVAPRVEAWIEILITNTNRAKYVASRVEAWIEMKMQPEQLLALEVASHVEAWIEIFTTKVDVFANVLPLV